MDFLSVIQSVSEKPEMWLSKVSYWNFCDFIIGHDVSSDGGNLQGFREWLLPQVGNGGNLYWPNIAFVKIFPSKVHDKLIDYDIDHEEDREAIRELSRLITEFRNGRDEKIKGGLRKIYLDHEAWLHKQSWYTPANPSYIETNF